MIFKAGDGNLDSRFLTSLRTVALVALATGAVGSVGSLLYASRHNESRILILLFTIWVLSPFMILVLANMVSKRWSVLIRSTLYWVMLLLAFGSLGIYGYRILRPPKSTAAFVFIVVPPLSLLLAVIAVSLVALISGWLSRARARR
jgi:hypothetical protein